MKVINSITDYIIVLKKGKIIEKGITKEIFNNPKQNYTKQLIKSIA